MIMAQAERCIRTTIDIAHGKPCNHWNCCATQTAGKDRRIFFGWFTEGFDTADLKYAKALLDELGA